MTLIDNRLAELGITLPNPAAPVASYVPATRSGNLLFLSGQLSKSADTFITGHLGATLDTAAGQQAARICAINILGQVAAITPLDKVVRVLRLTVLVASAPDFHDHHLVANGASDLLIAVLGEPGRHARAAFGVAALPLNAAVEIDAIVEISD